MWLALPPAGTCPRLACLCPQSARSEAALPGVGSKLARLARPRTGASAGRRSELFATEGASSRADHGHVGVVVGPQPLQPIGGDGAEAVGVDKVAGDGEGVLAAPLGLGTARAHRTGTALGVAPSVPTTTSGAPSPVPRSARRAGRLGPGGPLWLLRGGFSSSTRGRPGPAGVSPHADRQGPLGSLLLFCRRNERALATPLWAGRHRPLAQ